MSKMGNIPRIIRYLFKEVHDTCVSGHTPFVVTRNVKAQDIEGYVKEFQKHDDERLYRRKNSIVLYHSVLSWHPKSGQLTEKQITEFFNKFSELRGNCKHLAISHKEKSHFHIHVITSGTDLLGNASRQSKAQYQSMKLELERFQREKYPELSDSNVEHNRPQGRIAEFKNRRTTPFIAEMNGLLSNLHSNSHSIHEFKEMIQDNGLDVYYRNGKLQGISTDGYKYRFSTIGLDRTSIQSLDEFKALEDNVLGEIQSMRSSRNREQAIDKEEAYEREYDRYDFDSEEDGEEEEEEEDENEIDASEDQDEEQEQNDEELEDEEDDSSDY